MTTTNFEKAIRIDREARVIEVTKAFDKASSRFGTAAYEAMLKARQDNPGYRVEVKKAPKAKVDHFRGLTYEFMEKYIASHDNAEVNMATFMDHRAKSDEALEFGAEALSYGEIKAWFLRTYPEFAAFQARREAALAA